MSDYLLGGCLPSEIMKKILLALPVESIGRARCVNKAWHTLLSSHSFIMMHAQRNLQSMTIVALETLNGNFDVRDLWSPTNTPIIDCDDLFILRSLGSNCAPSESFWWPQYAAIASSQGLVCYFMKDPQGNILRITNLITEKYVGVRGLRNMEHLLGFYFEPDTCNFKIMAMSQKGVFLYEFSTNAWKSIQPQVSGEDYYYITEHIAPWAPYIACAKGKCYFNSVYDYKHLVFDMVNEEWKTIIDLPNGVYGRIQAWEDRVYVVNQCLEPETLSIWVLEEDRWVETINIDVRNISGWGFFPVIFHNDMLFLVDHPKVFIYSIKSASVEDVIDLEDSFGSPHFFAYKPTLFHIPNPA